MSERQAMHADARIYVAGHRGLVGAALVRQLQSKGYQNLILSPSSELDLRNQDAVEAFYQESRPDYVFIAAARVGGILANENYPAEFLYDNLMIEANLIHGAYKHGVKKLLFLGSTCIYPRMAPQPLKEEYLLTGPLEATNEWYAVAKIAGIKLCQAYRKQYDCRFISAMPTNLYGPGDNFDLQNSHVLPALIRKFHEARIRGDNSVTIWGSGMPRREFLHVDDCADACVYLMNFYEENDIINIGAGKDISILDLALMIKAVVGFKGSIDNDMTKPDGTPRKLVDITKIHQAGWSPSIPLEDGIRSTYAWYQSNTALELDES